MKERILRQGWPRRVHDFCEQIGISFPVIQAPMAGGPTTPALVVAVSEGGGLGSVGAGYMSGEALSADLDAIVRARPGAFAVNVFAKPAEDARVELGPGAVEVLRSLSADVDVEPDFSPRVPDLLGEQVQAIAESGAPVASVAFGLLPPEMLEELKRRGVVVMATATNVAEALAVEAAGYDAVVAQGSEAGGHRGSFLPGTSDLGVGLMALVPQVVDAVSLPVVAAGGIMDGRGVAAAMALGASCAQMGTAFLLAEEAGTHPVWKERLELADEASTVLTPSFSGKLARGIENDFVKRMRPHEEELPGYPVLNSITAPLRKAAQARSDSEKMSLWAGQGLRMTRRMKAADLLDAIEEESLRTMAGMKGG